MSWTWEDDCAREWERQNEPADIPGCTCRGGEPNFSECPDCSEIFCADCMEHVCDFEAAADAVVDTVEGLIQAIEDEGKK